MNAQDAVNRAAVIAAEARVSAARNAWLEVTHLGSRSKVYKEKFAACRKAEFAYESALFVAHVR